jgi:hypothetical protein
MRGLFAAVLIACAGGCFYDSSWGSAKRAQTNNAAHAAPSQLSAEDEEHHAIHARTYRLRAYVTERFAAQEIGWDRQIRDLVDGASDVLAPALGVRIEVDTAVAWNDAGSDASLERVLEALHAKDDGQGADWVAAFVGGIPQITASFHDLGYGDVVGKHLVVRAASTERAEIDSAFDKLSASEREKLARSRKRHRAVAVFLHEIGHTLGAIHESDAKSLMNVGYDTSMAGFSDAALALMRVGLDHRGKEQTKDEKRAFAADMLAALGSSNQGAWVEGDRASLVSRMRALDQANAPPPPPPPIEDLAELKTDAERAVWRQTVQAQRDGDLSRAWETGQALFKAYPSVQKVQDLRCTVAMNLVGWFRAKEECAPLMKLTGKKR